MKKVVVFFDIEANLVSQGGDNKGYIEACLKTLQKHGVHATLNVCGSVVKQYPEIFRKAALAGHEIASHGYSHENFLELRAEELNLALEKAEREIENACGARPLGVRSPWLYMNRGVYSVFSSRGYLWASNRRMRMPEIVKHPSLQPDASLAYRANAFLMRTYLSFQGLWFPKAPYVLDGVLEIPLLSSMDGELLGLVDPNQESSEQAVEYAIASLKKQFLRSKGHFNLTFHDWVIGSANRTKVLDELLRFMKSQGAEFFTASELLK
ncbi:MAG: polysaccharide deacetylase family protein [Candidatus Diapherotrites archaeon]